MIAKPSILLLAMSMLLIGCGPVEHVAPDYTRIDDPAERNFETLWMASYRTLKKCGFEVDRQDRRDGLMTTNAMLGSQMFEFWRKDSATWYNRRENTLQPIVRAVRVEIRPVKGTKQFDFTLQVAMARMNRRPMNLTDTSQLRGAAPASQLPPLKYADLVLLEDEDIPSPAKSGTQHIDRPLRPEEMITPLGWDVALAKEITVRIRARAGMAWQSSNPHDVATPMAIPTTAPKATPADDAPVPLVSP